LEGLQALVLPDPAGLASFVPLFTSGTATQDQVVAQFGASPEFP
jgi:hypothetical protein